MYGDNAHLTHRWQILHHTSIFKLLIEGYEEVIFSSEIFHLKRKVLTTSLHQLLSFKLSGSLITNIFTNLGTKFLSRIILHFIIIENNNDSSR